MPFMWHWSALVFKCSNVLLKTEQIFYSKVFTSEKKRWVGWQWYHSIGLALSYSSWEISVQSSCERPKTIQRTLFLLFENNYCNQISAKCHRLMKKSGKRECHVVNSNNAINSLPTIPISLAIVALYEKIYNGEPSRVVT